MTALLVLLGLLSVATIASRPGPFAAALDRIASENHDWDRYFAEHSITPLHITYEQLTREMDHTIRLVLDHVGAHVDVVPPPTTKSQSDALNAEWAERFVSEHPEHAHRRSIPRTN